MLDLGLFQREGRENDERPYREVNAPLNGLDLLLSLQFLAVQTDEGVQTLRSCQLILRLSARLVHHVMLSGKYMPKTPKGHKRPADVVSNAVTVMRIATGEIEETLTEDGKSKAAVELGRKGGKARADALSARRRIEIAQRAASKRWGKPKAK
jgi:hypothetical protein